MRNRRVLITGSKGFVGCILTKKLRDAGADIHELVRPESSRDGGSDLGRIPVDLSDRQSVIDSLCRVQPEFVIHLAFNRQRSDLLGSGRAVYDENVVASLNVIEACIGLSHFKRFVFLGSCDEYGIAMPPFQEECRETPVNSYGLSKLAVTKVLSGLFHAKRFPSVVLRPTVIYGPEQREGMFLPDLISTLLAGKEFPMTIGDQLRDFVHVDDVVGAIIKSIQASDIVNGTIMNIGSGRSIPVKQVARLVADCVHPEASRYLRFGEVPYRRYEAMNYAVSVERAARLLGWQANIQLRNGVEKTVNAFRSRLRSKS